jgi:gluconokinase
MPFVDGDDLHPKSNIEKMSSGQPLTDADREPWLELIRTTALRMTAEKRTDSHTKMLGIVVGCSALKMYYRDILRGVVKSTTKDHQSPNCSESMQPNILSTYFIFIDGPREILIERMEKRTDHFMKTSMLDSQLQTLETPVGEEGVMMVSLNDTTEMQVTQALDGLSRCPEFDIDRSFSVGV